MSGKHDEGILLMALGVWYWLYPKGEMAKGVYDVLRTADDVDRFVDVLSDPYTSEAVINHLDRPKEDTKIPNKESPTGWKQTFDHYAVAFIEDGYGAIQYSGNDGRGGRKLVYTLGDFENEPLDLESAFFPEYTFIPEAEIRAAMHEFLVTGKRPQNVTWRTEDGEIIETARKN